MDDGFVMQMYIIVAYVAFSAGFLLSRLTQQPADHRELNEDDSEPTSEEMAEWSDRQW
jgi:hypothetical protein